MTQWEQWNPRGKQVKREIPARLGVSIVGLVLNRPAVEMVGKDKRAVILYWNEGSQSIGLWFFKNEVAAPEGAKVYSLTHYVEGVARITPRLFLSAHGLIVKARATGKQQFLLKKEEKDAPGHDFYSATIA
jgi:hypothetical protein